MWTPVGRIGPPALDVVDDKPGTCEHCHGAGWRPVPIPDTWRPPLALPPERLTRCHCWAELQVTRHLTTAGVPARYAAARLGDYKPRTDRQKLALDAAKRFIKAFPATRGLWIAGEPGAGKTHLAAAVLRSAIGGRGAGGVFAGTGELLHAVRRTYQGGDQTEAGVLNRVIAADVLVLDDVGSDKPSEWAQTTIGSIVNARYNSQRPTIFTTTLVDLADSTDPRSVIFNLGVRTRSRLCEMCTWIEL